MEIDVDLRVLCQKPSPLNRWKARRKLYFKIRMGRFLTHIFELQEPLNFVLFLRRVYVGIKASELLSLERLSFLAFDRYLDGLLTQYLALKLYL